MCKTERERCRTRVGRELKTIESHDAKRLRNKTSAATKNAAKAIMAPAQRAPQRLNRAVCSNTIAAAPDTKLSLLQGIFLDTLGGRSKLAAHGFALVLLVVWFIYGQLVESYVMPGPFAVLSRLGQMLTSQSELRHMLYSFGHIVAAVCISFVIGSLLAFAAHYISVVRLAIHGRISPFLNSFSGIGWTFLAFIWFGISDMTVVFVIAMVLIPFAVINMREGLDNLDAERIEMANSFSRSGWRRFQLVILPSLLPFIFATIRISFGVAWKIALTAELFGGNTGLGYLLNLARQDFDMPLILCVIVVIVAFVYSTDRWVFAPLQARLAQHHGVV